eukprot:jgi/Botrbrau1/7916/Bobra.9_2s0084.1
MKPFCAMQEVLTNLMIARIEVRGEADPDVAPHVHHRQVETVVVSPSAELSYCRDTLLALIRSVISRLVALKVYNGSVDAETASAFAFKLAGDKLRAAGRPAADAATVQSFLKQLRSRLESLVRRAASHPKMAALLQVRLRLLAHIVFIYLEVLVL